MSVAILNCVCVLLVVCGRSTDSALGDLCFRVLVTGFWSSGISAREVCLCVCVFWPVLTVIVFL